MQNTSCERCQSQFFKAHNNTNTTCPFCGYSFIARGDSMVRKHERSEISRDCLLYKDADTLTVTALDISKGGVGILAEASLPISKDDEIEICIVDFDVRAVANISWISKSSNHLRAGIRFVT